jgi:ribosomal protein S18 acetylase RimI-like enzyme
VSNAARAWLAGPEEAATVARLLIGFRDHYGRPEPPDETFFEGVERLISRDDAEYLLAAPGGSGSEPGGVCQLRYRHSLWTASEDCWLEDLFVREQDRRAGLGEALVGAAIERARERGCGRVELDVSQQNRGAWALYERMGFSADYKPPAPNVLMGLRL